MMTERLDIGGEVDLTVVRPQRFTLPTDGRGVIMCAAGTGVAPFMGFLEHRGADDGDNWLLQTIIGTDADEYTVGLYGLGDGTYAGPIIMRRRLTRSGHTGETEVMDHPAIAELTGRIVRHFKPVGPTNLQFRVQDDIPYLLAINPRFSSSCSLRAAFGFVEAEMCIDDLLEGRRPAAPLIRRGTALRYNEDFIAHVGDTL